MWWGGGKRMVEVERGSKMDDGASERVLGGPKCMVGFRNGCWEVEKYLKYQKKSLDK